LTIVEVSSIQSYEDETLEEHTVNVHVQHFLPFTSKRND
jgi:hypothetical protein